MKIKINKLRQKLEEIIASSFYSKEEAREIAEVLLYADLTGKNTQGIIKLTGRIPIQNIKPKYKPKIVKETKLSVLIDGGGNPGILVAKLATKMAIAKSKTSGFGIIGTKNTFASTGVIGYYANEITKNDFVGIVMAGSPPSVSPHGSIDSIFGTNPIAFGFPTTNKPIIFDMATSAITFFGLVRAKALGQKIPKGIAIDKKGNITTDPEAAMNGAILPFDKGYKSSSLSLMVEIFTGPFVNASFGGLNEEEGSGNLFIAIDPELLVKRSKFKKDTFSLIEKIRKSRKAKGHDQIYIPGWHGLEIKEKMEKAGEIEIDDEIFNQL